MKSQSEVLVIGGGLAGTEAALRLAREGLGVALYEMRPDRMTEAHRTGRLAELVCSNSLKSVSPTTGSGLLKNELWAMGSVLLRVAEETRVPAGTALAVDREQFSRAVEDAVTREKNIRIVREEVSDVDPSLVTIVATGPLTSAALSTWIKGFLGEESLFFFDAISPIVDSESIDFDRTYFASRYDKGDGAYLNCPLSEAQYVSFWEALVGAELAECRDFEKTVFFEGCLPLEEVARRGKQSLAFGSMKPVGLLNPRTGAMPHAVVQLRPENKGKTMYSMVGFQTRLKIPEQKRVFRMITGLERAEFLRYGSVHRNSFINSPLCLLPTLQTRKSPTVFFAGQISGVEGYVESIATGLLAGLNAAKLAQGREPLVPPPDTALGSLCTYIASIGTVAFQPMNFNFGLLPPLRKRVRQKLMRKTLLSKRALSSLGQWLENVQPGAGQLGQAG